MNRLSTGEYYYSESKTFAQEHSLPFSWELVYTENIEHNNGNDVAFAVKYFEF